MDPCRTRAMISFQKRYEFLMTALCLLFFRQFKINFSKSEDKPFAVIALLSGDYGL